MVDRPTALRFAADNSPAGMAALALVRAMAAYLVATKRLHDDEIDKIRDAALEEFADAGADPTARAAIAMIREEFP